jgi:hypothetical protein
MKKHQQKLKQMLYLLNQSYTKRLEILINDVELSQKLQNIDPTLLLRIIIAANKEYIKPSRQIILILKRISYTNHFG